jgi:glycosylphosphatidylinositol transamidase (GPIT) subunit GPI8
LGVLKGDPIVGEKVLKSDNESHVFLYLVNSGTNGLIQMVNDQYLYADEIREAVQFM